MNLLLVSPWLAANLERLGWTLVHFLWQGTLVAALLAVELAVLRRASAQLRYLAGVTATALALLMPVMTFVALHPVAVERATARRVAVSSPVATTAGGSGLMVSTGPSGAIAAGRGKAPAARATPVNSKLPQRKIGTVGEQNRLALAARLRTVLPWCGLGWMLGVVGLSVRLMVSWTQAQRLCRRGTRALDVRWQARLEFLVQRMGVRRVVRLLESTVAEVPAVIGALRPVILLPVGMLTRLSTAQVEMILAHELAHIRRQDYLVNLGLTLFETLGFYHPATWWIAARVREEREHACDDLAVQATGDDRVGYARALATLEEMRVPAGSVALAVTSGGRGTLLARVRRLLGVVPERKTPSGRNVGWLAGALALLLTGALTLGSFQHPARAQTEGKSAAAQEVTGKPKADVDSTGQPKLTGRVVDEAGKPVAGALVYDDTSRDGNVEFSPVPLVTDTQGVFRMPKLHFPGQWRFIGARLGGGSVGWLDIGAGRQPAVFGADDALTEPIVLRARRYTLRGTCVDEQGKPVAGATVAVTSLPTEGSGSFTWQTDHPEEPIYHFWDALRTNADADGKFALSVPLSEGMQVEISAPGRETVYPFRVVKAGVPPVLDLGRVVLAGAGRIAGRIVFAPHDGEEKPLPEALLLAVNAAELRAAGPGSPPEHENVPYSDAQGRYQMEHLPAGTYTVYFFGLNHEDSSKEPVTMAAENVVVRAGETTPLDLRAVPGKRLRVRAIDPDTNLPVRNLPVHFVGPSRPTSSGLNQGAGLSDQGECTLKVAPGHYWVFVSKDYGSNSPILASAEVDVSADRDPDVVKLDVKMGPRLRGKVQDAQGKPIPLDGTAVVTLLETSPVPGRRQAGSRSSDGSFDVSLTKTGIRARLVVDVPGYRAFLSPEFAVSETPEPMTVTLEEVPDTVIWGRVLDQDGQPVVRGSVDGTIFPTDGLSYPLRLGSGIPGDELLTDEGGRFETHRIRAGAKFRLDVLADGRAVAASADWTQLGNSSMRRRLDIEMHGLPVTRAVAADTIGPRDLSGHVVDGKGAPIAGAKVTVVGAYPEVIEVTTNAAGWFRFPEFGDRHYVCLEVEKAGYGTAWQVDRAVGRDLAVRLDDTTRLRGQLRKPNGSPAGAASIALFKNMPTKRPNMRVDGLRQDQRTDEHGAYDFPVQPGEYRVEIRADGENLVARYDKVGVPVDQITALPEQLEPGLSLRIRTVDGATSQPAPGARFYVREQLGAFTVGPRPGSERQTDADGYAQWDHLFPGEVFLDVNSDPIYARFWTTDPRSPFHLEVSPGKHPIGDQGADGSLEIRVLPGRGDDPVVVETERGVQVSGRVLDPQDKPLGGAVVHTLSSDPVEGKTGETTTHSVNGFQAQATNAEDGTFHACLPAADGGLMRLVAEKYASATLGNGHSEAFPALPGDQREVTIHLTPGGWIEGDLIDSQGKPLAQIPMAASAVDGLDGYVNHINSKTDARGHFRIGPLRPTEYDVRARGADWDWNHPEPPEEKRRVTVKAGESVPTGMIHFDPKGWTAPAPTEPATPPATPAEGGPASPAAAEGEMLTAVVKIVDEAGKPIVGVTVTPDGLRARTNASGHYFWPTKRVGEPVPGVTDAAGMARVPYPRTVDGEESTGAISFRAEQPDYCAVRSTHYLVTDDPARAEPEVLHRGSILHVSGHLAGSTSTVPVYPQQDDPTHFAVLPDDWKDVGGNGLETHQIPAGRNFVRLAHREPNGTLFFSETQLLNAVPGQTYSLDLELRRGVRVEGRLDDAVPRPVRGGRVVIHAYATSPESDANQIAWYSSRDVAADGTFVFESLPPGRLEATALCGGYTSAGLEDTEFNGTLHIPQHFELPVGGMVPVVLRMQAAASCTVQVRDAAGAPVSGAQVNFSPNVRWTPGFTTIFCMRALKMEDYVTPRRAFDQTLDWLFSNPYKVTSDAQGNATVCNLPAGRSVRFGVAAEGYDFFPASRAGIAVSDREGVINLQPGENATATARLTKKGAAAREAAETPVPAATPAAPVARRRSPDQPAEADVALAVRTLPGESGAFTGRVVDEAGKGLPGVLVDAWTWFPGNETTTDADGAFRLTGLEPQRQIEVRFSKEGFTPRLIAKQPLGGLEQPLALTTHTYFEGAVIDPDGQPAVGALVRANQGPKDADGIFLDAI